MLGTDCDFEIGAPRGTLKWALTSSSSLHLGKIFISTEKLRISYFYLIQLRHLKLMGNASSALGFDRGGLLGVRERRELICMSITEIICFSWAKILPNFNIYLLLN
jgi:hypothetical protein